VAERKLLIELLFVNFEDDRRNNLTWKKFPGWRCRQD